MVTVVTGETSPSLSQAPKIRVIRRNSSDDDDDNRDSPDIGDDDEDEQPSPNPSELDEGMQFFDAFQGFPSAASANNRQSNNSNSNNNNNNNNQSRTLHKRQSSSESLDIAEYALNEAMSGALVGENVLDSPPVTSRSVKKCLFEREGSAPPPPPPPPPQQQPQPQQPQHVVAPQQNDPAESRYSISHTIDISLDFVSQGFSWIKNQREERRLRALQEEAEEQARIIREAEFGGHQQQHTPSSDFSPAGHHGGSSFIPPITANHHHNANVDYPFEDAVDDLIIQKKGVSCSGDGFTVEFAIPEEHEEDLCWVPTVRIEEEDEESLSSAPFLLDSAKRQLVAQKVLPPGIAYAKWKRLYSLARDGDSFEACLRLISGHAQTLMVVRTAKDELLGGFGDYAWNHPALGGNSYFGGPTSCLYSFSKRRRLAAERAEDGKDDSPVLCVYKWTGANRYIQLCDSQRRMFAFGGGGVDGAFGLAVAQDFQHGSSGPCDTFGNEPLASEDNFAIVDLELYSFLLGQF